MSVPEAALTGGGFRPDTFDDRDHYYEPNPNTVPAASINLRQKFPSFFSDIYDQDDTNACTAHAAAAALWFEEKAGRREAIWGPVGPSRNFIYWLARLGYVNDQHDIADVSDTGSNSRDAMKGIAKCGACLETDWPWFDIERLKADVAAMNVGDESSTAYKKALHDHIANFVNQKPSDTAFTAAAPHTITRYFRLDPQRPDENVPDVSPEQRDAIGAKLLNDLKKCLTEGYPVAFGYWYYLPPGASFDETQKPFVMKDVWNMPGSEYPRHTFPADNPPRLQVPGQPGHSVLAVGYDDARQQVLIQNSWGADWSEGGLFWMPYAWITDFAATNDFWTIRST